MTAPSPIFVSVGGGKGGVGKSVIATNVAVACAQIGMRTILVDADLGAPNLHTMLGIDRPGLGLGGFLDREVATLEEASIPTPQPRLRLVPGLGAVMRAANPHTATKDRLLRAIRGLDAEIVVIDVGAGVGLHVIDFFALGDLRLIVTAPQLTAMQNAYCFVKSAILRSFRHVSKDANDEAALTLAIERRDTEKVATTLARVAADRPELAARCERVLHGFGGALVGNMTEEPARARPIFGLGRMAKDFLGVDLPVSAEFPLSRRIHQSVTRRVPVLLSSDREPSVLRAFHLLAEKAALFDRVAVRGLRAGEPLDGALADTEAGAAEFETLIGPYLRRDERSPVSFGVVVRGEGDAEDRGDAKDASERGARLILGRTHSAGTKITIDIPTHNARIEGVVRHVRGLDHGVEIEETSRTAWRTVVVVEAERERTRADLPNAPLEPVVRT